MGWTSRTDLIRVKVILTPPPVLTGNLLENLDKSSCKILEFARVTEYFVSQTEEKMQSCAGVETAQKKDAWRVDCAAE